MTETVSFRLLNAATATGDGSTFDLIYGEPLAVSVQIEWTGSPTALVVSLKGLIDGSTFDTIATFDITRGVYSGQIFNMQLPVGLQKVKANLGTLTGGGVVSLYFRARL